MSPLREYKGFTRYNEEVCEVEVLKRIYLILEGQHTENKYFKGIINNKKELGINNLIELIILDKDGKHKGHSDPKKLLELIDEYKVKLAETGKFDKNIDLFVIVFDRDSFKNNEENKYREYVDLAGQENLLAITNPCFELWLILHYEGSLDNYIAKNKEEILKNEKVSNSHTYTSKLFSYISVINSKSNLNFIKLKGKIDIAIKQERLLPMHPEVNFFDIGSNIGVLIEKLREDPRDLFVNK